MSKITPIHIRNRIDSNNSTSSNLIAGGSFTGEWTDITQFGLVYVNVIADVDSATNGLSIQQSSDGLFPDHSDDFTIAGMIGKNFSINTYARYLRIVYDNGGTGQSYFKLQVILKSQGKSSTHKISEDITTEDDTELVKSVQMIKANDQDEYKNIELNNPMPVNTDQLYQSDINIEYSDMYNFSGSPIDISKDRWTPIVDSTATNPKLLKIEFERPIQTSIIGITTETGSFSNTVIKYGLTTSPSFTLIDESTDSTAKTLLLAPSIPITLTRLEFEFHTANTVTLSGINLARSNQAISQIQGIDPDGELLTVGTSRTGNLNVGIQEYGDTSAIDAFARLRISEPFTLFDSKQLHDKQPLFWDEITGGSSTSVHSSVDAATVMTVTASATDYVMRQTKQRFNYQPGKSSEVVFTFHAPQQTGIKIQIGAFDGTGGSYRTPNNGIFIEITESEISWNIAKNGIVTETAVQADWNYDKMDSSGPSGLTLDIDAAIIAFFDIEWLGVGRVRCGFYINGLPRYVHYFTHSNNPSFTSVYMSTPNLPLRYYIESDGTGGGTLDHICSTVISEGGIEETGILRSVDTGSTHVDASTANTTYAIVGVRLKSTHIDITVIPEFFSMINEAGDDFRWSLCMNPTIAGTFTYSDLTNSAIQSARGATANTVSDEGLVIDSGYAVTGFGSGGSTDRKFVTALRMGSSINGTRDEIVLCATPLTAGADIQGSLSIRELL